MIWLLRNLTNLKVEPSAGHLHLYGQSRNMSQSKCFCDPIVFMNTNTFCINLTTLLRMRLTLLWVNRVHVLVGVPCNESAVVTHPRKAFSEKIDKFIRFSSMIYKKYSLIFLKYKSQENYPPVLRPHPYF